ncbi:M48 family metallopeptidase [Geomonas paludis]|uniref:M48 family metallopeptidase n=1 Tax=Geomonas paludis TaxID=2740185 RepID=A0ABY4LGQ5_9BACT|nr:M48 family metallopeptidase [Geomonas paludis]UPU37175.1 M48 family metallopeptidase [Geomonas paludis]
MRHGRVLLKMNFEPRYCEKNVNAQSNSHFGEFIRLTLWLLGIVFVIYLLLGYTAEKIAERLPPKFEAAIAGGITSKFGHSDFPSTQKYLQKVLDSLVSSAEGLPPFAYRVIVVDENIVNAVALPAGNIVVFKGLVSKLKNENEVAIILAHELGHYAHRDHLRGLGRGLVLVSIMTVLGVSGDLPGFISPSVQTFDLKHSRDRESAADRYAMDLFVRTYGHSGGTVEVFKVLAAQEQGGRRPELLSTHPDTLWRIQSLTDYLKLKKYPNGSILPLPKPGVLPFPNDQTVKAQ